ncbi:energy-coupling factor ABC transporter ATP-binding protein [Haematomicrobium sanguinis]|uniref:energy-coupling factor ABC transporter ATP-binding protein n=1 Tax=Haematomicrobium sanguinis TaxID=479106 RepID=UPI00047EEF32|nr:ABC transporter ATP-binding protein [Haematomicrobium sanguinis]
MLEFSEVSYTVPPAYDGDAPLQVLRSVSLVVPERRVSVLGLNGSGKSTLLRLVNGLVAPTSGLVRVDGMSVARDGAAVRRAVGFVFTDPNAQLVMPTVLEDVELSLRRTVREGSDRRDRALAVLARLGVADLAERSVHELSGGQRQLVALASVLATSPSVLVADEPTTLLDMANRERVRRVFAGLEQQIVFATHDLEFALDAERTVVIHEGSVYFDGAPSAAVAAYTSLVASLA